MKRFSCFKAGPVSASAAGVGLPPLLPGSGRWCDVIADVLQKPRAVTQALISAVSIHLLRIY